MAWTTQTTWAIGDKAAEDVMNEQVRDNQLYLYDHKVPSGNIAIWTGTIANIPSGWVICDGNNGTPNLLAKFVEGVASAITDPGTTGGALSKTTENHRHAVSYYLQVSSGSQRAGDVYTDYNTDSVADIRPPYYDVAFIMKT
jgi:hypothetical protein